MTESMTDSEQSSSFAPALAKLNFCFKELSSWSKNTAYTVVLNGVIKFTLLLNLNNNYCYNKFNLFDVNFV
jgi:hypothetical protein